MTPKGKQSFEAKQKQFRERIAEESKRKEPSQFKPSSSIYSVEVPASFPQTPVAPGLDITSSLNSSSVESNKEPEPEKKGKLSDLIYGTKEGREMDKDIEHSFSQVLARGKYVHSIVFHEVKSDKVDEYVELVGKWYPKVAGMEENKVHLVGSWRTEVGDCDTFGTISNNPARSVC